MFLGSFFVVFAALAGIADALYFSHFTGFERGLLLVLIFITARAQASSPLVLIGILLAYFYMHSFTGGSSLDKKILVLISPWKLSVLGFALMLFGQCGRELHSRFKRLMEGCFSQVFLSSAIACVVLCSGGGFRLYRSSLPNLQSGIPFRSAAGAEPVYRCGGNLRCGLFLEASITFWAGFRALRTREYPHGTNLCGRFLPGQGLVIYTSCLPGAGGDHA